MRSSTIQAQNKETFREAFAAIDRGDFGAFQDLLASDYVCHFMGTPEPVGRDSIVEVIKTFYAAFPDNTHVINDLVAEGDKVAARLTEHATHKGQFQGIPATGRKVICSQMHIATIVDGKFKESWVLEDNLGRMRQIGMELRPAVAMD
jgi:steroid delta-isomerase-like uncharacterized protein